jgi:hypothetical protein
MTWWQKMVSSQPVSGQGQDVEVHYGRALKELTGRLKKIAHPRLLDLGLTCGANIEFFIRLGCKVHVDDYAAGLLSRPQPVPPQAKVAAPEQSFSPGKKKPARPIVNIPAVDYQAGVFQAVLCWDLFDYLSGPEAEVLAAEVNRVTATRGFLLALFGPARYTAPRRPRRFRILDDKSVRAETVRGRDFLPHHLPNRDIAHLFADYEMGHTVLLKDGTREMLLRKRRGSEHRLSEPRMVSPV